MKPKDIEADKARRDLLKKDKKKHEGEKSKQTYGRDKPGI
jgi:hypothetical protein